jgi:hypothetical protein
MRLAAYLSLGRGICHQTTSQCRDVDQGPGSSAATSVMVLSG